MWHTATVISLLVLCVATTRAVNVTKFTACALSCVITDLIYPSATSVIVQMNNGPTNYISFDEGQHWNLTAASNGFYQYPQSPLTILFPSGINFQITTDGGATFTSGVFPTFPVNIQLHKDQVGWILITTVSQNTKTVVISKDFGQTWKYTGLKIVNNPYPYVFWGSGAPTVFGDDIMYMLQPDLTFGYSLDYNTFIPVFSPCAGFYLSNHYLFAALLESDGIRLLASSNKNDPIHVNRSSYIQAEFSGIGDLPENGYTFLDDSAISEFIGVSTFAANHYGNLFSSDFNGAQYSLSLPYIAQDSYYYDFDIFSGLQGIYIADAYPNSNANAKSTYITYNNGGQWNQFTAPAKYFDGSSTNCQATQGCYLQLHGILSWYFGEVPPYYTSPNAIGLIVAIGSLGSSVVDDTSKLSTYFSRDAGLSWIQLYPEVTIYEFGDHGGILVFATMARATTMVFYSTDEGNTLQNVTFYTTALWVQNIIIEPSGTGQKFVLIATATQNSGPYVIFGLDFSDANLPMCTDSDYENWSPSDGQHGSQVCFMGSTNTYIRRKQFSNCYNNRNTDHLVSSTPCACTFADYECDTGFTPSARNSTNGFTCSAINGSNPLCLSGYRLIADSNCTQSNGGLNPSPYGVCGGGGGGNQGAVLGITFLIIVLVGGAGTLGYLYNKNDRFRTFILSKFRRSEPDYSRVNVHDDVHHDLLGDHDDE